VIRTALAICDGGVVRRFDLPREIRETESPPAPPVPAAVLRAPHPPLMESSADPINPLHAAERAALLRVIEECHGNMTRVAIHLGMSRNTLYRRIKRHGIPLAHGTP
jgi:transcriptional regulator of acetoin/glycerol metabolism